MALLCESAVQENAVYKFYRNNEQIGEKDYSMFRVENLRPSNSGSYSCSVTINGGAESRRSNSFELTVEGLHTLYN